MTTANFWHWYDSIRSQLGDREISFTKMFQYLDTVPGTVTIVETGCTRQPGNWSGDGQSTVLFDQYVQARGIDSCVYSVDIDESAVTKCRNLVSAQTQVTASDSVGYLQQLGQELVDNSRSISLLYLDSYDVDFAYWFASAAHHLKELAAVGPYIDAETLVVVDDCGLAPVLTQDDNGNLKVARQGGVGGKGRLVAEYATAVDATLKFAHYQVGWTNFRK